MGDTRKPTDAEIARPEEHDQDLPFRRSSSAGDYAPAGNWGAERGAGRPLGDIRPGMEGDPTSAGDGGFGPEGGFSKDAHSRDVGRVSEGSSSKTNPDGSA